MAVGWGGWGAQSASEPIGSFLPSTLAGIAGEGSLFVQLAEHFIKVPLGEKSAIRFLHHTQQGRWRVQNVAKLTRSV